MRQPDRHSGVGETALEQVASCMLTRESWERCINDTDHSMLNAQYSQAFSSRRKLVAFFFE